MDCIRGTASSPILLDSDTECMSPLGGRDSDAGSWSPLEDNSSFSPLDLSPISTSLECSPVKVLRGEKYRDIVEHLRVDESEHPDSSDSDEECQFEAAKEPKNEEELTTSSGVPIFEIPPAKYSAHRIMKILLDPNIDDGKIAKQRPLETHCSATFVVDVTSLKHPDDIKKDMYGKWSHHGSHIDTFRCSFSDEESDSEVFVEKAAEGATGANVYYLRRLHSTHPSDKYFRRIVAFITDAFNQPHHLCLVVYYLPENFVPIVVPHGNSKTKKPFFPTLPSTMAAIKEECSSGSGPKETVLRVSSQVGGITHALDACELPRSEQQVSSLKQRQKLRVPVMPATCAPNDELGVVMQKAYLEDNRFIREIQTLREPAIIVASDRQLSDVLRFCCRDDNFGVLTIDPTFSLGEFDVTITTYRHLVLKCRRTGSCPAFIGPTMVHYRKTFATYLFFSSSLIGLRPELTSLKCFGTDGESALYQAFHQSFPTATHLLCSNHVRRNIKSKFHELSVSEIVQNVIMQDIFGKQVGTHKYEGLVDSNDEKEYERGLESLSKKWKNLDAHIGGPVHCFVTWFLKYKSQEIKHGLLRPQRQKAGLGNPPMTFTTNASESVNALIKKKVNYKKSDLPAFLDKLEEATEEQQRELEKAVIDRGKYRLSPPYQHLQISEQQWFTRMSISQREAHLKKVAQYLPKEKPTCNRRLFTSKLGQPDESQPCSSGLSSGGGERLSVSISQLASTTTPVEVLKAIWSKASRLLQEPNAVMSAPGCDQSTRMVKSTSGSRPHVVTRKRSGQFCCDGTCPNWRSLGICAHSVAAAEDNQQLQLYVNWFVKAKKVPNLSKLVTTDMPAGRGRKGGAPPRKRFKHQATETRTSFATVSGLIESQTDEDVTLSTVGGKSTEHSISVSVGPSSVVSSNAVAQNVVVTTGGQLNVQAFGMPSSPPPLLHVPASLSPPNPNPFVLAFVTGNIRVCHGCRQNYVKPAAPPLDLCVRHKEWQRFGPADDRQSRYGNVYYHCNIPCIQAVCREFVPAMLEIPPTVLVQLLPVHTQWVRMYMPGRL